MRLLASGDRAVLAEFDTSADALRFCRTLDAAALPQICDVVPADATVLVVTDEPSDTVALRRLLTLLGQDAAGEDDVFVPRSHVIPVRYSGPDLDEVQRQTRLTRAELIEMHSTTPWSVSFNGFAPGFAYLRGPEFHVRRRREPRVRVSRGAVGLAGRYCGIYPREGPGGWQLIGDTTAELWHTDRMPPARLLPGDSIVFEPVR